MIIKGRTKNEGKGLTGFQLKIIEDESNYIKDLIDDLNISTRLKNKKIKINKNTKKKQFLL